MDFSKQIDKLIRVFSPETALKRQAARVQSQLLETRSAAFPYDSGAIDRNTSTWLPPPQAGDVRNDLALKLTRNRAWDAYRNDPTINAAVRYLVSRVVGVGLKPESLALDLDGKPDQDFRTRASQLWKLFSPNCSDLGCPGAGGITMSELQQQIFRLRMVDGECLVRFVYPDQNRVNRRKLVIPLTLQVIEADRIRDETWINPRTNNVVFRGIEIDSETGERVSYHLYGRNPWHPLWGITSQEWIEVPASEVIHVYNQEQSSQIRGVSALAPILRTSHDLKTLMQNEVIASTLAACMVFNIENSNVFSNGSFGTLAGGSGSSGSDSNGNQLIRAQPGQVNKLGPGQKMVAVQGTHPNTDIVNFRESLIQNLSTGIPGTKGSTLTGNYRNSSFSSEKSCELDKYPEILQLQEWFAANVLNPIWRQVINTARANGYFDGFNIPEEMEDNWEDDGNTRILDCRWVGGGTYSLNPVDDENASTLRKLNGNSSLITEAAEKGRDWREILHQNKQVYDEAKALGLPEEYCLGLLGIKVLPVPSEASIQQIKESDQKTITDA